MYSVVCEFSFWYIPKNSHPFGKNVDGFPARKPSKNRLNEHISGNIGYQGTATGLKVMGRCASILVQGGNKSEIFPVLLKRPEHVEPTL